MSLFSAVLKGLETEFKLLIVRREREIDLKRERDLTPYHAFKRREDVDFILGKCSFLRGSY